MGSTGALVTVAAARSALVRRVTAGCVFVVAIAAASGACLPEGRACAPGDFVACSCSGGASGVATCDSNGSSYGVCDCTFGFDAGDDGSIASSDAAVDGGSCSGSTNLAITCPCTDNSSCASAFCFTYPSKGPHCTAHCTTDAQCPPPALGCNPQGICKVP